MSGIQDAVNQLSTVIREISLPRGFPENYDPLECLAQGHGTETYLVQRKTDKSLCVAKLYDRKIYTAVHETAILKSLRCDGLPAFLDEYENNATVCVVREYIAGTPLDAYVAERPLTEAQAVTLCAELCDILLYIHGLIPPVIHRDIKPQNLIMRENGHVALIDFDIARTYNHAANTDTQFIATRTYAPPEQYGFSQTDCRTDIYSLGVLLCFLLTGDTDVKNAEIPNRRLAAVVRRCTAFSPEERFADAANVKRALLNADGHRQKAGRKRLWAAALVLLCLCAGFAVGRYTAFLSKTTGVRFAQPLIEKAVRVQLGKDGADPITAAELPMVRELCIFGNEVAKNMAAFSDGLTGKLGDTPRGTLTDLSDLNLLPNLEALHINYETLIDISPVASLRYLTYINLRHTFVADLSPLIGLPHLRTAILFDTHVEDASSLAACPLLNTLDVGQTLISSLDALPAQSALKSLSLAKLPLASLDGIERYVHLESLCLHNTGIRDLSPLKKLPVLRTVNVDESMRGAAEALGQTPFTFLYK